MHTEFVMPIFTRLSRTEQCLDGSYPVFSLLKKNTAIKLRTKSVGAVAENDTPLLGIFIPVLLRS